MPGDLPLAGCRVLDLSQYIPGPFATRQLADLGAEVIKIEPPGGDPMRRFACDTPPSPAWRHLNRGKRVVRLDLKSAAGREHCEALVQGADVLLESFRPGALARLGLGRERLRQLNPGLIHCALSGFGQTGPWRERAGHDLTYCAVSAALGPPRGATTPPTPLADHAGAMQAVNAILAALLARQRTGRGAFLDVALNESILSWQYLRLLDGLRPGILAGELACYRVYLTDDGRRVALAALEPHFWQRFCDAVGHPEWIRWQHNPHFQDDLIRELEALFASRSLAHWQRLLDGVDCCFEPVLTAEEIRRQPQLRARGMIGEEGPAAPLHLDGEPLPVSAPPQEEAPDAPLAWTAPGLQNGGSGGSPNSSG